MNKTLSFFVCGTDTDIGKTYISRILADTFALHHKTSYFKPVQSGGEKNGDGIITAPDYEYVIQGKARKTNAFKVHVPYLFEPACSPHLAASLEGVSINPEYIKVCFEEIKRENEIVITEGAGGLYVPLSENFYNTDLIKFLDLPALLVTDPGLGTLNHTMLSVEALKKEGINIAGIIFNNISGIEKNYIYRDNIRFISEKYSSIPFLEIEKSEGITGRARSFCNGLLRKFQ